MTFVSPHFIFGNMAPVSARAAADTVATLQSYEELRQSVQALDQVVPQAQDEEFKIRFDKITKPLSESSFRQTRNDLADLIGSLPDQEWMHLVRLFKTGVIPLDKIPSKKAPNPRMWPPALVVFQGRRINKAGHQAEDHLEKIFPHVWEILLHLSMAQNIALPILRNPFDCIHQSCLLEVDSIELKVTSLKSKEVNDPHTVRVEETREGPLKIHFGYRLNKSSLPDAEELAMAILQSYQLISATVPVLRLSPEDDVRSQLNKIRELAAPAEVQRQCYGNGHLGFISKALVELGVPENTRQAVMADLPRFSLRIAHYGLGGQLSGKMKVSCQTQMGFNRERADLFLSLPRNYLNGLSQNAIWKMIAKGLALWFLSGRPTEAAWPLQGSGRKLMLPVSEAFFRGSQYPLDPRMPPDFVKSMAETFQWFGKLSRATIFNASSRTVVPHIDLTHVHRLFWMEAPEGNPKIGCDEDHKAAIVSSSLHEFIAQSPRHWIESADPKKTSHASLWAWARLFWNYEHREAAGLQEFYRSTHVSADTRTDLERAWVQSQRFSKESVEAELAVRPHIYIEEARTEKEATRAVLIKLADASLIHFNGLAVFARDEWNEFFKLLWNAPEGETWYSPGSGQRSNRTELLNRRIGSPTRDPRQAVIENVTALLKPAKIPPPKNWDSAGELEALRKKLILHYHPDRRNVGDQEAQKAMKTISDSFRFLNPFGDHS